MENTEQISSPHSESIVNKEINPDLIKKIWIIDNDDEAGNLNFALKRCKNMHENSNTEIKHFIFSQEILSSLEKALKDDKSDKLPQAIFIDYTLDPRDKAVNGIEIVKAINKLYENHLDKPILIGFTSNPVGMEDFKHNSIRFTPEKDYSDFAKNPQQLIKEAYKPSQYNKYIK